MIKNEKIDLFILLLTSLLLSTYLFCRTYVISLDGAFQYIPMAKLFVSGLLKDAIGYSGQQPFYSFLIAFVSTWVSDFEVAGKLVSSFFGVLIILPVYFLGKTIFDQKVAFFSALFLAIHPYMRRFSADVLKESTYLFFLAIGIWFTIEMLRRENRYSYLFIPFFSALAYLVRADGIELLLVAILYILFLKTFNNAKGKWVALLILLLSSCILLLPYIIHLRGITGEWTLSKTKSVLELLGLGERVSEVPSITRIIYSVKALSSKIFAIYHPLFIFLLAVGFLGRRFPFFKEEERFLIAFFFLHCLVLFSLILNLTGWESGDEVREYLLSGRHTLPLLLISIYWIGEGFLITCDWVLKKLESRHLLVRFESNTKSKFILITLLILAFALILPKTLEPQRYERLPEKWAGLWIKDRSAEGSTILTTVPRVAYYAGRGYEYVDFEKIGIKGIERPMDEKKARYLVIQEKDVSFLSTEARWMVEVKRFAGKGLKTVIIYQRVQ